MDRFRELENFPPFAKPKGGFWASPAQAPFGWVDFCRREDYEPSSGLQKKFCFALSPEAQILRITAREDFDLLPKMKEALDSPIGKIPLIDCEECARRGIDAIEYCYSAVHSDGALGDEMDQRMLGKVTPGRVMMVPTGVRKMIPEMAVAT